MLKRNNIECEWTETELFWKNNNNNLNIQKSESFFTHAFYNSSMYINEAIVAGDYFFCQDKQMLHFFSSSSSLTLFFAKTEYFGFAYEWYYVFTKFSIYGFHFISFQFLPRVRVLEKYTAPQEVISFIKIFCEWLYMREYTDYSAPPCHAIHLYYLFGDTRMEYVQRKKRKKKINWAPRGISCRCKTTLFGHVLICQKKETKKKKTKKIKKITSFGEKFMCTTWSIRWQSQYDEPWKISVHFANIYNIDIQLRSFLSWSFTEFYMYNKMFSIHYLNYYFSVMLNAVMK